jgi:hypothetical protein
MSQKATFELIEWAKMVADQRGDDGYWNLALAAKAEQSSAPSRQQQRAS